MATERKSSDAGKAGGQTSGQSGSKSDQGGKNKGNFANDPKRASDAGKKGGSR
jgi:general stress protein YciG